ncbi:MAG: hypothetical protein DI529_06290 [Chryseobacterium sp.]|nr:MAG: hypothetical protein DI529_06290 [Chryseobacterium sp.]
MKLIDLKNSNSKMNIIDWKKFTNYFIVTIIIFFIYAVIVFSQKEKVLAFINYLFNSDYSIYSKAFAGFTFFPFLIIALMFFILLQHYFGKIRLYEFKGTKSKIKTTFLITIDISQIIKISVLEKDKNITEIKLTTHSNKYSVFHPVENFVNDIKNYLNLKDDFSIEYNQGSKTLKKTYILNKNTN